MNHNSLSKFKKSDGYFFNFLRPLLSLDSRKVYLSKGFNINVYSTLSGDLLQTLKGHNHKIIGICINPLERNSIISCDTGGNIIIWNISRPSDKKHVYLLDAKELKDGIITHFDIYKDEILLYSLEDEENKSLFSTHLYCPEKKRMKILEDVKRIPGSVSHSRSAKFLAALQGPQKVLILKYPFSSEKRFITTSHQTTCIACHPLEDTVAVGDVIGSIILFHGVLRPKFVTSLLHWHTLPLADLIFSYKGTELYSGGGECVLVLWQLTDSRNYFLPRLGGPLKSIATDCSNNKIVVIHKDNDVSILNAKERRLEGKISSLMYHDSENPLPVGLLNYPGAGYVFLNGRTGHLQMYDPISDNLIYHLDVTMCNYISNERHKIIPNSEVEKAAISSDGTWMATCEGCPLSPRLYEIILKFWAFSKENQGWKLNTSIQKPHNLAVNSISFIQSDHSSVPLCVTCGEDGKFKMWQLFLYKDVNGCDKYHWNCIFTRDFRDEPATASCFSLDGSLLAVAFNHAITLWKVDNCSFIGVLTKPFLAERIRQLAFCGGEYEGSILISCSETYICSWNLLSCSLLWHISLNVAYITVNPLSGYIAAFSHSHSAYIICPKTCKVVSSKANLHNWEVIGATFVRDEENSTMIQRPWKSPHHLVFVTKDQLFFTLELPTDKEMHPALLKDDSVSNGKVETPFAAAIPSTRKAIRTEMKSSKSSLSQPKFFELLDNTRIHNMESFSSLLQACDSFVPTPSISHKKIPFAYSTKKINSDDVDEAAENQTDLQSLNGSDFDENFLNRVVSIDFSKLADEIS